jgi:hypothetical protein
MTIPIHPEIHLSPSVADAAFIGLIVLLLLAGWGLIALCDRLMEDSQ